MQSRFLTISNQKYDIPEFINIGNYDNADFKTDVKAGLPYAAQSVEGIYCAHFIETLSQTEGISFLRECRRVLDFGGFIRISTINLDLLINSFKDKDWFKKPNLFGSESTWLDNSCEQLNMVMREWDHKWLYNEQELKRLAEIVGLKFEGICEPGDSKFPKVSNLERNNDRSLFVEFSKPKQVSKKEPLVSILIPAYNPKYFEIALKSALNQSYKNIEIIISDDREDDKIKKIASKYNKDKRIRYYQNEKNLGAAGRENYLKVFTHAKGQFIKYLNDDDFLAENCVEQMLDAFQKYPQATLVTSYRRLIDAEGNDLPDEHFNKPPVSKSSLINGNTAIGYLLEDRVNYIGEPTTVMFRKSDIAKTKPNILSFAGRPALRNGDVTMWINLLSKGDLIYLTEPLSLFRRHEAQRQHEPEYLEKVIEAWQQILFDTERMGLPVTLKQPLNAIPLNKKVTSLRKDIIPEQIDAKYKHLVRDKLDIIDFAHKNFKIKSVADLGGVWGVNGGYTFFNLDKYDIEQAYLVDTNYTPQVLDLQKQYPNLKLIQGNFGEQSSVNQIKKVDAVILFDVLLHQVKPDWNEVLERYSKITDHFIIYNQQFIATDHTVRLLELGKEEYFKNVPHTENEGNYPNLFNKLDEIHPEYKRKYRDIHNIWQWGIVDNDLYDTVTNLGFEMVYYKDCGQFNKLENFHNHAFVFVKTKNKTVPDFNSALKNLQIPVQPKKSDVTNGAFKDVENLMKRDWNERAKEDARYYVRSTERNQPEEEFDASGADDVEKYVTSDLNIIGSTTSLKDKKVLEIGCGLGRLTKHLASVFAEVHAVDVSAEMIRGAKERLKNIKNAFVSENSGSDLSAFNDSQFDFVFSFIVFQHIPSREVIFNYFKESARVLKPGGIFKFQVQGSTDPDFMKSKKDTWLGEIITKQDVEAQAAKLGFILLHNEGEGTQYSWYTLQKAGTGQPKLRDVVAKNQQLKSSKMEICNNPIFVVGCPRSGTSVMSFSLGKHSQLKTGPESNFLEPIATSGIHGFNLGSHRGINHWLSNKGVEMQEFMEYLGYGMNLLYTQYSQGKRWIDQTPQYTLFLPEISMLFPGAVFVNMIRDGRDVVNSMLNSGFPEKWATDFTEACNVWKGFVLKGLEIEQYLPNRIFRVYNEYLKKDGAAEMQQLSKILNIPYELITAENFINKENINSSYANKNQQKSNWRTSWSAAEKQEFNQIAGKLLIALGYEENNNWVDTQEKSSNKMPDKFKSAEDILNQIKKDTTFSQSEKESEKKVIKTAKSNTAKEPLVSIIIPVFNNLKYTVGCLEAIEKNTNYPNYEIIIVDNASSDGTGAFLESQQNSRLKVVSNKENKGFVEACNQGAGIAEGDYIFLLNNDTEVQPNWLTALVKYSEAQPNCGAIGSKLVYGDKSLQEAGGIIFSDGNGWNYGRNHNPADPRFNFVREVDYCSGAALMVKRALWEKIGGLDMRYAPAYYEDTDMCFSVREKGYKVYYHPHSVVIHHEGKTAGTDLGSGFKRYQEINRVKFVEKWQNVLKFQQPNNPANVAKASNRQAVKNILMLDPFLPFFDRASGSLRLFQILKIMRKLNYHVTFISRNGSNQEIYKPILENLGIMTIAWDVEGMRNAGVELDDVPANVDYKVLLEDRFYEYAIIDFWDMAEYYLPIIRKHSPKTKIIIDSVDIHFIRELREAELHNDEKLKKAALSKKKKELAIYKKADQIWTVTDDDRKAIEKDVPRIPINIIPNIHNKVDYIKKYEESEDLLFVGNFNHPPNRDAAKYLCTEILPEIKKKLKNVKLYIVGNNPPQEIQDLAAKDVVVTGYVKSLNPYLQKARISVNPLRYGAGMKGKIGEALSWGLPVVTSSVGAEGMKLQDGVHALISDEAKDFAEKIVELYNNQKLWEQLSDAGRELVRKNWSPEAIYHSLAEVFGEQVEGDKDLVSIVMLTFNALEYTKKTINSIYKNTKYPFELIIVDNASKADTKKYLQGLKKKHKNIKLILNNENKGFAAGNNQGVKKARGKYVLLLNNDVLVSGGWLESMVQALQLDDKIGMVGPITNHISGLQMVENVPYSDTKDFTEFANKVRQINRNKITPRRRIAGFAVLMLRGLYESVNGFDEAFGNGNFEDDDLCLRVRENGYAIMVDESTFIHHFGSQTFKANKMDYTASLEEKGKKFRERWPQVDYQELLEINNPLSLKHPKQLSQAADLLSKGDLDTAVSVYNEIILENPIQSEALLGLALTYNIKKDFSAAISNLNNLLRFEPENGQLYNQIGIAMRGLGDLESAEQSFLLAIEKDSNLVDAQRNYGDVLIEKGAYEQGVNVFLTILKNHPEDIPGLLYMSEINLEAGRLEEAMLYVQQVLKIDKQNNLALQLKGIIEQSIQTMPFDTNLEFVICVLPYNPRSGGTIVMHKFCHMLNERGVKASLYPLTQKDNKFEISRNFNTPIRDLNKPFSENEVVVYPEIVSGNPLNAKHVVRWLLNKPGVVGGDGIFNDSDILFYQNPDFVPENAEAKKLRVVHVDFQTFKNQNKERKGQCFFVGKSNNKKFVHTKSAIEITENMSPKEIAELFNTTEIFYCYDNFTFHSKLAALSGCLPVVIPDGTTTEKAFKKRNPVGIAYGKKDIEHAKNTMNQMAALLQQWETEALVDVANFVSHTHYLVTSEQQREDAKDVEKLQMVALLVQQKEFEQALPVLNELLLSYPNEAVVMNLAGLVFAGLNDFDAAKNAFIGAIQNDNKFVDAQRNYGHLLVENGQFEEGINVFLTILQNHPDDIPALLYMCQLNYETGRVEDAALYLKKALEIEPKNELALQLKDLLILTSDSAAENSEIQITQIEQANIWLENGDADAAEKLYKSVLNNDANDISALFGMAICKQLQEDFISSKEYLEQILKIEPEFAEAYNAIGNLAVSTQNMDEAIENFSKSLKLKPQQPDVQVTLADVLINAENYDEGIQLLVATIKDYPEHLNAILSLGYLYLEVGNPKEAKPYFERAQQLDPNNEQIKNLLETMSV